MTDENHSNTETTETGAVEQESSQEQSKMFSQQQLDEIVAKRVAQTKAKYSYEPDEVAELRKFRDSVEEEQLIKRQDFDKVLAKHREKSTGEINSLRSELTNIKVDGALVSSASKGGAIAPDHVAALLKTQVQLDEAGKAIVVDNEGKPRYNEDAEPMSIDQLTAEFLASNQFFKSAGPAGTGSESNVATNKQSTEVDLSSLDLTTVEGREKYRKLQASGKLL
jgi:hypothetical protein